MMEQGPVDPNADFLKSIDMSQLHRCVLLHSCLGKLTTFQVGLRPTQGAFESLLWSTKVANIWIQFVVPT